MEWQSLVLQRRTFHQIYGIYVSAYFHYSNILIIQCFTLWHYSEFTWPPWLLKSPVIRLFVQYNNKANIYLKGESTLCYGWIPPLKWPLLRRPEYRTREFIVSAACHPDGLVWGDISLIMGNIHPNPTPESHKLWPTTHTKRQYYDTLLLIQFQK